MIGARLGPYEVTAKLGEGGMGEVYRAHDAKLGRDVAIKVLPEAFTADAERLARFEREARALAQLQHQNVASIYGLEEADGVQALVMELVEGPTLAERLASGPLPVEEALRVAQRIAGALEAAHGKGIVHRDLKPQNVKASEDGTVKVLDFGLAKAFDPAAPALDSGASASATQLDASPTLTLGATLQGVILGTAAYMAPEQAKGGAVDKRADVWAFGVVLWEMLTGKRLFEADTAPETLAQVLTREPDLDALPASVPPAIRRLLGRCLRRDPRQRLHDVADARIVIDDVLAGEGDETASAAEAGGAAMPAWRRAAPWTVAAAAVLALAATWAAGTRTPADRAEPRAVEIGLPNGTVLSDLAAPALSPDGRWIVYAAAAGYESSRLWLRPIDGFEATPLPGTEEALFPFWSPDSRHVGFFVDTELRRLDLATRTAQRICDCAPWSRGGAWAEDGTILFAPSANSGIHAVPATGGAPVAVTTVDPDLPDGSHRFPVPLPDGEKFLFTVWSNNSEALERVGGVYLGFRSGGAPRRLLADGSQVLLAPPDRLLLHREGKLVALAFDPETLEIGREAIPVSPEVQFALTSGDLAASASAAGDLLFAPGGSGRAGALDLVWFDRRGAASAAFERRLALYNTLLLSPDGSRFVAVMPPPTFGADDLWVGELARGTLARLTRGTDDKLNPRWSPDGRRIAYVNRESGDEDIFVAAADGAGEPRLLFRASEVDTQVLDWSPDGATLLFAAIPKVRQGDWQIWSLDLASGETAALLAGDGVDFVDARLSPDGRWLAYVSDESGQNEVHVRPYPGLDRRWQLSREGGEEPHWRADGAEIVYRRLNQQVFAVAVAPQGEDLAPAVPELLFTAGRAIRAFSAAADHGRFLAATLPTDFQERPLRLILGGRSLLHPDPAAR